MFFVVPVNGPALPGMPDYEESEMQSVNCTKIDASQKKGLINKQLRQDKSCVNKDLRLIFLL